ncbi:MAG: dihydrofolate reductase family protein [Thermoflexales bacterium]
MAKLIYLMFTSLDGYTEDARGDFGWGAPDEVVHAFANELAASVGTYLNGRKMYEIMVYWETAHSEPNQPKVMLDFARQWQAAEKIVFSRTLAEPRSARTRIVREFDPGLIRRLKAEAKKDMSIDGPELAGQAIKAGLVDEIQMILCPVMIGGGKRFLPEGVRLDLELFEERRFDNGMVYVRYAVRN